MHPPRDMENVLVAIMAMALPILYSTALDVPLLAVLCTSPNRSPGALLYGCSWRATATTTICGFLAITTAGDLTSLCGCTITSSRGLAPEHRRGSSTAAG